MTARPAVSIALALALLLAPLISAAQSDAAAADDLQAQINEHNAQIDALNKEIAQYEQQLNAVSAKKQTLQGTISQLNISIKKTTASISVTKNQISTTQLQIQQLGTGIVQKQASIQSAEAGIAESLRELADAERQPLSVQLFSADSLDAAWNDIDRSQALESALGDQVTSLSQQKQSLTDSKTAAENKQAQLLKQQRTLTVQQGSLSATKSAQNDLLSQTKQQESTYQSIIAQKRAQQADLEAALSDLKSKYNVAVNPNQITPAGKGILQWPLDSVRITQYFGNTPFAQTGAYNGKGHNGIDLAAPIGTPIHSALSGVVIGTGNTDAVRGCYSFGKWVMVKHDNGLSTMYAHLSQISVSQGQQVATGQLLGYSGETGYATGPHLHFGVYVTAVTQILKLGTATNASTPCANAVMPVPPISGYLNPLNYLPAI